MRDPELGALRGIGSPLRVDESRPDKAAAVVLVATTQRACVAIECVDQQFLKSAYPALTEQQIGEHNVNLRASNPLILLARPERFELPTLGSEDRCSIR